MAMAMLAIAMVAKAVLAKAMAMLANGIICNDGVDRHGLFGEKCGQTRGTEGTRNGLIHHAGLLYISCLLGPSLICVRSSCIIIVGMLKTMMHHIMKTLLVMYHCHM